MTASDWQSATTAVPESYITTELPLTLPVPIRAGYDFAGWYDNAELTGDAITTIPTGSTGNKTYYAKWATSCPVNYFVPEGFPTMCFPHRLHVGDNLVYLKSEKLTTPSLNVQIGNDMFYANMTTTPTYMNAATEHYLKMSFDNTVYYVCDDTTYGNDPITPVATDKQSCSDSGGTWINETCVYQ